MRGFPDAKQKEIGQTWKNVVRTRLKNAIGGKAKTRKRSHKKIPYSNHATRKRLYNNIEFSTTFNEKDYNSNDGMLTSVWGPTMWHYLHTMSFNYPVHPTNRQKEKYRKFILSLKDVLPCGKCRKNLTQNFKKLPLTMADMKSRETFSKYIYNLHELINKMLGKKSNLTYEMVRDRYENFRSRCIKSLKEIKKDLAKEKGCTEPLYGEKSKCVLKIVPHTTKCDTLQIDSKCIARSVPNIE